MRMLYRPFLWSRYIHVLNINVHKCCLTHGGLAPQNREYVFIKDIMIKLSESLYSK